MNRRDFLAGTALLGTSSLLATSSTRAFAQARSKQFNHLYAPHEGLFEASVGKNVIAQIEYAASLGFRAWEDNGMAQRPESQQREMTKAFEKHNMQMGVFVSGMPSNFWQAEPVLSGDDDAPREAFLSLIKKQLEVAKRVNAKWTTVVPGFTHHKIPMGYQTANIIELLHRACDIYEPHGVTIVLEPLNTKIDHPNIFIKTIAQAYAICTAVNRPSCKILADLYHEQIQAGDLINTIDRAWDHIAYIQVADNPGRKEPTTGEINYRHVFSHLYKKGFKGIIGMEHGQSIAGIAGEKRLVEAYREVDNF